MNADLAAIEEDLVELGGKREPAKALDRPKRQALALELSRTKIHHEPQDKSCPCGCQLQRIGQDVTEKLDYVPGTFSAERHIRSKWVCRECETLVQAPMPAQIIDKGLASSGLLPKCSYSSMPSTCPCTGTRPSMREPA